MRQAYKTQQNQASHLNCLLQYDSSLNSGSNMNRCHNGCSECCSRMRQQILVCLNNYICNSMKGKVRIAREEEFPTTAYTNESYDVPFVNRPIKSPSPDKKSANIIVSTRSPDIHQLKRTATPTKEDTGSQRTAQRSELKEKHFQLITTPTHRRDNPTFKNLEPSSIKNVDTGTSRRQDRPGSEIRPASPRNSRGRNIKIEIAADEDGEVKHSASRYRSEFKGELSQLDYLKILKTKEEAISELKDYINTLQARTSDDSLLRTYEARLAESNKEIRELKIENQYLFSAIEKEKAKDKGKGGQGRQQQLQKEIRRLEEALEVKQNEAEEVAALTRRLEKERQERKKLEAENESLLRMLKERQQDEKREQPLSTSSLSQQGRTGSDKDRLSLVKIKEIHQQNIKIAQESFYSEVKQMEESFLGQLEEISAKVEHLEGKLARAEAARREIEGKRGLGARQDAHREKERHQEIESVLLEKYSYYERQIQDQKRQNEKLTQQLSTAHKDIEQLQLKSLTYSRELSYLTNHEEQELLDSLNKEIEAQTHTINTLQKELSNAQKQLSAAQKEAAAAVAEGEEAVRVAENKLMIILEEYESKIKAERAEHQEVEKRLSHEVNERDHRLQEMEEHHQREKTEIEQQLTGAINLYEKEISGLKHSLLQKNAQILALNEQLEKSKLEAQHVRERRDSQEVIALSQEKDHLLNQVLALQKSVELLSQQLQESTAAAARDTQKAEKALKDHIQRGNQLQRLNQSLKDYTARLEDERHTLQQALTTAQQQLTQNQQEQVEVLARLRAELDKKDSQLEDIKKLVQQGEEQIGRLEREKKQLESHLQAQKNHFDALHGQLEALRKDRKSLHYQTIQEELKELRQMITDYYATNQNRLDNEIVQEYYRLVHAHELKIEENMRLAKEAEELRTQAAADSRERLILSEKIALLENNIAIYERELRERRHLYDQVLQEKVRIQKEVLLSKRIKAEQSALVQGFKASTTEIASKIDRLVDFERTRYRQIRALVEEGESS